MLLREESSCQPGAVHTWPHSEVAVRPDDFRYLGYSGLVVLTARISAPVKGFGCRPMTDGAANAKAGGRRPKASKEGNRGKYRTR